MLGEKRVPVWRIVGRLKPSLLAAALEEDKDKKAARAGKPIDSGKLPRQLPDHVVIHLGQANLFPYRIEYRRSPPGKPLPGKQSVGSTSAPLAEGEAVVVMNLYQVAINVPIPAEQFDYNPGNARLVESKE